MASLLDVNFDVNQAIKDAEAALGKYGPVIVDAAKHQVAAQAGVALVLAIFLSLSFALCLVVFLMSLSKGDWDEGNGWVAAGVAVALAGVPLFIAAIVNWTSFYMLTNAPDWAALQLLKP